MEQELDQQTDKGKASHTAGPWRVEADIRTEVVDRYSREEREYVAGWNVTSDAGEIIGCEGITPSDTAAADALLCADAPAMLEALQDLADIAEVAMRAEGGEGYWAVEAARKLIARHKAGKP